MKIVSTILLVIAFLAASFLALQGFVLAADTAEKLSEESELVQQMALGMIPSPGRWLSSGSISALLAILTIVGIVATFSKSKKFGLGAAGAIVLFAILAIVLTPSVEVGRRGMDPFMIGIIVGVINIAAAAVLGLIANKREA